MDLKDVSGVDAWVAYLQKAMEKTERAKLRKGDLVHDHPAPEEVMRKFMVASHSLKKTYAAFNTTMTISQIPPPYPPCTCSVDDLQPLMISDLRLETHHRGFKIMLRIFTHPNHANAIMVLVEDEMTDILLLQLYNQPEESDVPAEQLIGRHRVCIIKEPYFKCSTGDGQYTLRVDHPSDIVWLADKDDRIPAQWKVLCPWKGSSSDVRNEGNAAVKGQKWAEAERIYSFAADVTTTAEEKQMAYLNRSLANLQLGHSENALEDAARGSEANAPSEKRLFREARALYEMGHFQTCLERLQRLMCSFSDNKAAPAELLRATARLHEQETGEYNYLVMYKDAAEKTPPLMDCATYSAPVDIRPSPGRGNGLFTTRAVNAGELLLCEKAFAYSFAEDNTNASRLLMNLKTKKMILGGQASLLTQVVQKVYNNPQMWSLFRELHHGDYAAGPYVEADGKPVIDTFLVESIISRNCFGAPRTSREAVLQRVSHGGNSAVNTNVVTADASYTTAGIWLLASRINHSCVGNCRRAFIGDMQLVRATCDIPAGTELLFAYRSPKPLETYAETQEALKDWGFTCGCALCLARKATTAATLQRRMMLRRDIDAALGDPNRKGFRADNFAKIKQYFKKFELTYHKAEEAAGRQDLCETYFALGAALLSINQPGNAIETIVKGLAALGFVIQTYPSVGGGDKVPRVEVQRWGVANDFVTWAFIHLHKAYKMVAPELCDAVKPYIVNAYCMMVGEPKSASDTVLVLM